MAEKRCMRCGHGPEAHYTVDTLTGPVFCQDWQRAAWALPLKPEKPRPVLRLVKGGRE